MPSIKVLIIEDEVMIAQDLKACLCKEGFNVNDIAYDKQSALKALVEKKFDIVLLDINLEGRLEGLDIAKKIHLTYHLPFIFLTSYANATIVDQAKQTCPMGYVVKPYKRTDVITTINIALHNFSNFKSSYQWNKIAANLEEGISFTPREQEILKGIYEGLSNQELSQVQFVSTNTIKTHVKNIYSKLSVHNRSDAIIRIRELLN